VVVFGLILSYILQPLTAGIFRLETRIFKKCKSKKAQKRMFNISVLLVYVLLFAAIMAIISFIIPGLIRNITELANNMESYIDETTKWYDENLKDSPFMKSMYMEDFWVNLQKNIETTVKENILKVAEGLAGGIFSAVGAIFNFSLIIAISIYSLFNIENIKKGIIEFLTIRFGKERTGKTRSLVQSVDWVFGKYISAKLIQTIIMFIITQIVFAFMGVKFSTLLALFVAVCNIIPFIGPIIGAIPAVVFSLFDSVGLAIGVIIAILIIQQIDAYVIDPFLVGDKMGLSPFWVISGVVISSNLFGLLGVILCVPVMAVIRLLIKQYITREKEKALIKQKETCVEQSPLF
jgi:predicted PurR-regulated permease PerM